MKSVGLVRFKIVAPVVAMDLTSLVEIVGAARVASAAGDRVEEKGSHRLGEGR
jgi:hypothetical protein